MTAIVVATADWHVNNYAGLCPRRFRITSESGDQYYNRNDNQKWLWRQWRALWERVSTLKELHDCPVIAVVDGDAPDLNSHTDHLISTDISDVVTATVDVAQPMLGVADCTYVVAGTAAHVGKHAEAEKLFAREIGAELYYWLPLQIEDVRLGFAHRPISNSTRWWTANGGALRTAKMLAAEWYDDPQQRPQLVTYAHVHHEEHSGDNVRIPVRFLPPFCTLDYWTQSGGRAGFRAIVGGNIYVVDGESLMFECFRRRTRREPWISPKLTTPKKPERPRKNFINRLLRR